MAQHEQSQATGQLAPEPTVVTQRPLRPSPDQTSIASHSQSGSKRTKWAEQVEPDEISAWGHSIARREMRKAPILKEVYRKYGASAGTAKHWFSYTSKDGLTPAGKSLLKEFVSINSPGAGLSEAQFHQMNKAIRSGQSVLKSLVSIGRNDISKETVRVWFDLTADDGLSVQGRRVLQTIGRNAYLDGHLLHAPDRGGLAEH
jgi:hypothetical protein